MASSPASDALQMSLQQFGQVVTHRPRGRDEISIKAVFAQGPLSPLTDNRQGRSSESVASIVMGLTDVNGATFEIDDQGEFEIVTTRWAVTSVGDIDGGYVVALKLIKRNTMRSIHGNS